MNSFHFSLLYTVRPYAELIPTPASFPILNVPLAEGLFGGFGHIAVLAHHLRQFGQGRWLGLILPDGL